VTLPRPARSNKHTPPNNWILSHDRIKAVPAGWAVGESHRRGKLTVGAELAAKMSRLKVVGDNLTEDERASFIHDFDFDFDGGGTDDVSRPCGGLGGENLELFFFFFFFEIL
jgi:hypothetical protein